MRRSSVASALAASVLTAVLVAPTVCAADPLIIHEWGTFTSLQDEQGRTIGGLNVDEEQLPGFVHDLRPVVMGKDGDFAPRLVKGVAACHPSVTMRLETPVVYVHLPAGQGSAVFDLTVEFRGGFLSQFYPSANAVVDGAPLRWRGEELQVETRGSTSGSATSIPTWTRWSAPDLTQQSRSMLTWRGVRATRERITPPATTSPVWLAPRKVDAAGLVVGEQQERYLFYRGLAHLDAPLRTMRVYPSTILQVGVSDQALSDKSMTSLPTLWFADLRGDGTAAVRRQPATNAAHGFIDTAFTPDQFSTEALAGLRRELHAALVADGLFADEAEALLATWEASYFKSAGQRLFFLVPATWTEQVLPLSLSVPAKITRTMVGRIEVVSPEQRRAVERIAAGPVSDLAWFTRFQADHISYRNGDQVIHRPGGQRMFNRVFIDNDRGLLAEKRVEIPGDYRAYLSLGRFRDALLWDGQRHAPDPEIALFLRTYVLTWIPLPWQAKLLAGQPTAAASVP